MEKTFGLKEQLLGTEPKKRRRRLEAGPKSFVLFNGVYRLILTKRMNASKGELALRNKITKVSCLRTAECGICGVWEFHCVWELR